MVNPAAYSFTRFFSQEDAEWVAVCVELPGLSGLGISADEALREAETAVEAWLGLLSERGEPLPLPAHESQEITDLDSPRLQDLSASRKNQ